MITQLIMLLIDKVFQPQLFETIAGIHILLIPLVLLMAYLSLFIISTTFEYANTNTKH